MISDKWKKLRFLTGFKTNFLVLLTYGVLDVLLLRWLLENLLGASSTKRYGFHFASPVFSGEFHFFLFIASFSFQFLIYVALI